jgi:hypothetical protein
MSINDLALALQSTVSNVLQFQDEFDINSPLEFQMQLNGNRGRQASIRFKRLQLKGFLAKAVLGFLDSELN